MWIRVHLAFAVIRATILCLQVLLGQPTFVYEDHMCVGKVNDEAGLPNVSLDHK